MTIENSPMIPGCEMRVHETRIATLGQQATLLVRGQHGESILPFERQMSPDQRQDALSYAPATDDDDASREIDLNEFARFIRLAAVACTLS